MLFRIRAPGFRTGPGTKGVIHVLNLIMTHSPRMAAMTNNKRYAEDAMTDPRILHRLALRSAQQVAGTQAQASGTEHLREQTA